MVLKFDDELIRREQQALKDKGIEDNIKKRIEQLLEDDIYKLTDDENNYL